MNKPLVTIIVPNFNNTVFLGELVDSIARQSYPNWELIVIDDGSTDNSFQYAMDIARHNPSKIRVIGRNRLPKGGQTCRNIGIQESKGEYIVFFDSDDLISEDCLEQRVSFMESHQELDFGVFPAHSFKPREDYKTYYKGDISWGNPTNGNAINLFLRNEYPFLVVTSIFRKGSLSGIEWDEKLTVRQDLDFNLSLLFSEKKYDYCPNAEYDYFYRVHHTANHVSGNMTTPEKYESMVYLFDKIFSKIESFEDYRKEEYAESFKRYIVNYLNQIVICGDKVMRKDYLVKVNSHFSICFINRMRLASWLAINVPNKSIREYFSYCVFLLLFGHKFYFQLIDKAFLKIRKGLSKVSPL